jgi:hypothetical protein
MSEVSEHEDDEDSVWSIEGPIKYTEDFISGPRTSAPSEYLSEHENGNLLDQIREDVRQHEPPVTFMVTVSENGSYSLRKMGYNQ